MAVVREVTAHFDAARQREFRRFLVVSAGLHLAAFAFLAAFPTLPVMTPPGAITVNLVAPSAATRGAAATPAPKPAPRPPKPAPVVLPKEPSPPPKPQAAPKPKPKPEPRPEPALPPPPVEEDYGDVMAKLRQELGETAAPPDAAAEPAPAAAAVGGGGSGPARPVSPEVAAWLREARIHVRRTWVVPPGFRTQSLQTVVEVDLDASGALRGEPEVVRRSGNPWYDEGVVRSIRKASPLPAPPQAGTWTFVMVSDEVL